MNLHELLFILDCWAFNHDPALHRSSGNIKDFEMLLCEQFFGFFRSNTENQRILVNTKSHIAVHKMTEPAEHVLLCQINRIHFDACFKFLIVGHILRFS